MQRAHLLCATSLNTKEDYKEKLEENKNHNAVKIFDYIFYYYYFIVFHFKY